MVRFNDPAPLTVPDAREPVAAFTHDRGVVVVSAVAAPPADHGRLCVSAYGLIIAVTGNSDWADVAGKRACLTCAVREVAAPHPDPAKAAVAVAMRMEGLRPPALDADDATLFSLPATTAVLLGGLSRGRPVLYEISSVANSEVMARMLRDPVVHGAPEDAPCIEAGLLDPTASNDPATLTEDLGARIVTAMGPDTLWECAQVTTAGDVALFRRRP